MTFASPGFLLLLPGLVLLGWFSRGLQLHRPLRACVMVMLVLVLANPKIRKQQDALDLFVLLDRSLSTESWVDQHLAEWQRLLEQSKPNPGDTLRWINFAAETAEAGSDGATFTGARHLTRTHSALATVAAMAAPDRPTRVLLFTDGFSTEPVADAAEQLRSQGIPLDLRLQQRDASRDFRVTRLDFPERVQTAEPFLIAISVQGPMRTGESIEVPVRIRRDGSALGETTAKLVEGRACIEFTDRIARSGGHSYQAEVVVPDDPHPGNNTFTRWIEVRGGPRVVLISPDPADPLLQVLKSLDCEVDHVTNPQSLGAGTLSGARAVVIQHTRADTIPQTFLKSLDFFVREQGGGLLMTGGQQSFGAGGYFKSPIDPLLPVSMELKSEHRKLAVAMAIVLDRSGSMAVTIPGGRTKMDLANTGAAEAVDLLAPLDQVAVFAVDSEPNRIVALTAVGQQKKDITRNILKIRSSGGGIFVHRGLEAAWKELQKSQAGTRHVILFSDAQDSEEPGDYQKLLRTMGRGGCTVSVIGLGCDSDCDADLLKDIAKLGKGRMFFSDNPVDLPKIFQQETVTIARSAFLREPFPVRATGRWLEISPKNIDWPASLDGYNLSYARPDAAVSLVSGDEYLAPLVAHARRGLGRTMAISFPITGEASGATRNWPGGTDFLQTCLRFLIGPELPPGIALRHRIEGTRLTLDLRYDPETWGRSFAAHPPRARISNDSGEPESSTATWRRMAPGHFSLVRDLAEGAFVRGAVQCGDHTLPFGPVGVGSAVEWAFDPQRPAELLDASAQTGGRQLADLSQAWLRPPSLAPASMQAPLLVLLLLAIIADALITRTGWRLPSFPAGSKPTWKPSPLRWPTWRKTPAPLPGTTTALMQDDAAVSHPQPAAKPVDRASVFARAKDRK